MVAEYGYVLMAKAIRCKMVFLARKRLFIRFRPDPFDFMPGIIGGRNIMVPVAGHGAILAARVLTALLKVHHHSPLWAIAG